MIRAVALMVLLGISIDCRAPREGPNPMTLDDETPLDRDLQSRLESTDLELRSALGMAATDAAAGLIDLKSNRLAMLHPDRIEYGASVPKVGILYAYFVLHPDVSTLDERTRHELGEMAKASSNELAAKFSQQLGLKTIQEILNRDGFYDSSKGGGIWVGKHYGITGERYGDPVGDHSHGITVRQMLRFWLLLDQGRLVSPAVSTTMKEIFASPQIPHDDIKFVKALKDRNVAILRKWGEWENWQHDTAIIEGENRRYILVGITNHPKGDDYLIGLAQRVDDLMQSGERGNP
jgi:beta-lactamase class A